MTIRSILSGAAGSGCAGLCPGVAGTEGCISGRGRGCLGACSGWTQLGPVAAEHEIARVDAERAGGCTVDNLTINPRASPLKWSRFCINMRSQWEWHQMMGFLAGGLRRLHCRECSILTKELHCAERLAQMVFLLRCSDRLFTLSSL